MNGAARGLDRRRSATEADVSLSALSCLCDNGIPNWRECLSLRARGARARSAHSSRISPSEASLFVCFGERRFPRFLLRDFLCCTLIPSGNHGASSRHECTNHRLLCSPAVISYIAEADMSLASSPDFQVRPEDKAFDTLYPAEDPLTHTFD